MNIEDHIPYGYRNRIDRVSLEIQTGCSDRENRQRIEEAILERGIAIANVGGGYFRPDGTPEDTIKWREYCLKELKRSHTLNQKCRVLKAMMPKENDDSEDQMSIFEILERGVKRCQTG